MKKLGLIILILLTSTQVYAGLDAKGGKVINVADPTAEQDAATKIWVETQITDANGTTQEAVQDWIWSASSIGTTTLITLTYDDTNNEIDFVVDEASIDHDALTNFLAAEHIDWTAATDALYTTGTGTFDTLDITTTTNLDGITTHNAEFTIQNLKDTAASGFSFAANTGDIAFFAIYADGNAGSWAPYLCWETSVAGRASMCSDVAIDFMPSNDITDYIRFQTVSNVPEITTLGNCDLKITSSSGEINFDDDDLTTTGDVTTADLIMSGGDIYPSADSTTAIQINKADGTTNVLNVDTTNARVGIGTASPSDKLEVAGTVNATAFVGDGSGLTGIITTETDPTVPASVKDGIDWSEVSSRPAGLDDGDDVGITSESDPQVGINTTNYIPKWNGSALISGTIYDNGNVGIGTASPSQKLDIVAGAGGVLISDTGEGRGVAKSLFFGRGGGTWIPIMWGVAGASSDAGLHLLAETEVADDSGNAPLIRLNARQRDSTPITTRPLLAIENDGSQLVTVDKDGNVGIGTATPSEALDLSSGNLTTTGSGRFDSGIGVGTAPVADTIIAPYLFASTLILANDDGVLKSGYGVAIFDGDLTFGTGFIPSHDNRYDLGSATLEWKNLYIDGTAYIDTLDGGIATVTTINEVTISKDAISFELSANAQDDYLNVDGAFWLSDIGDGFDLIGGDTQQRTLRVTGADITLDAATQTGWGTSLTHVSNDGSDHSFIDQSVVIGAAVNFSEIFNSAGDLKIMPDVQGNVIMFGDTDVDDGVAGNTFRIWRKAAEGDHYYDLYFTSGMTGVLLCSSAFQLNAATSMSYIAGTNIYFRLGDDAGARAARVRNASNVDMFKVDSLGRVWTLNKVVFTQTDGNEYIDSLTDGYLDIAATTTIRMLADISLDDSKNIIFGSNIGTKIGTATNQKLAFYNSTPIVKPTGVAVSAAGIHAALVNLGLIAE